MTTGSEKPANGTWTQKEKTAYHEAGHAVVAVALGDVPNWVSITPAPGRLGRCHMPEVRPGKEGDRAAVFAAGPLAEKRATGHTDCKREVLMIARYTRDFLDVTRLAKEILDHYWPSVKRVADALLVKEMLDFQQLQELVRPKTAIETARSMMAEVPILPLS